MGALEPTELVWFEVEGAELVSVVVVGTRASTVTGAEGVVWTDVLEVGVVGAVGLIGLTGLVGLVGFVTDFTHVFWVVVHACHIGVP